jgi:sec-independent protein translocase protein TatB
MLSIPHMIVLFIVVLVVFGPQKLPELARGLGKIMAEFRKASTDFKSAFEEEMREMERQTLQAERKKAAEAVASGDPATPAGTETAAASSEITPASMESPVISPVAESVPHSPEAPADTKTEEAIVSDSHDIPHDTQRPS